MAYSAFLPDGSLLPTLGANTVAELLALTTASSGRRFVTGGLAGSDTIEAASDATDQHVTTAGGVKLYVRPENGKISPKAWGIEENVVNTTAWQSLISTALIDGLEIVIPAGNIFV